MSELKKVEELTEKEIHEFLQLQTNTSLTANETKNFLKLCILHQLNPFKREIYITKYGNQQATIITGYEVYIKRAELSGRLNGYKTTVEPCMSFSVDKKGNLRKKEDLKATVIIYRKDFDHPFEHSVKLSEYIGRKRDGEVTKFWLKMPETMLKKVAISQGFRLCFNEVLGGMPYTKEEMNTDVNNTVYAKAEIIEAEEVEVEEVKTTDQDLASLKNDLLDCKSRKDVNDVFTSYPHLMNDDAAINLCKNAVDFINNPESEQNETN